jgi:phage-related protein
VREIIFYKAKNGSSPIEEFLDSLPVKQAKKITWVLQLIEMLDSIPIQYFKKLDGTEDIWEVRVDFGNDAFRLLGFFDEGNLVILTNGFAKKTRKTPISEISLAERRKTDYQSRKRKK